MVLKSCGCDKSMTFQYRLTFYSTGSHPYFVNAHRARRLHLLFTNESAVNLIS